MIIGFLGKGGSGKSSVSTAFSQWLHTNGIDVLAIDADHNMDLAHNLVGSVDDINYLGNALSDLLSHTGTQHKHYSDLFFTQPQPEFSFSDTFTKKYSVLSPLGIRVMAGGPHTDAVMFGQSCSHVLTTPLKAYLPLLNINEKQAVVIDEKAGADGAGTGIVTGMTLAIIVVEPTPQSVKAAKQIANLLSFFNVPYDFLINKDKPGYVFDLDKEPIARIPFSQNIQSSGIEAFTLIAYKARNLEKENPQARYERSKKKFQKNREYVAIG